MKKVLLTLGLVLTMSFAVNAQDGFFRGDAGEYDRPTGENPTIGLPNSHGLTGDQDATPLGSGLLILGVLGGAYALRKRNSK